MENNILEFKLAQLRRSEIKKKNKKMIAKSAQVIYLKNFKDRNDDKEITVIKKIA